MAERISIVGAGLIGQAWAIVFARGGLDVVMTDINAQALSDSRTRIAATLDDLQAAGLVQDPGAILARISFQDAIAEALDGATYVQECGPEKVDVKRAIFAELEALTSSDAILASSTSGIVASDFNADMKDPSRALVAHPVNPPSLVPLVEIAPSPVTREDVVSRTQELMAHVGQSPILVRKEIEGFILNRLQGALLNEALRLFGDGYASADDIDRAMRDGLGRRWAFMGPLETIDLNAANGAGEYAERYGPLYERVDSARGASPWGADTVARLVEELRAARPAEELGRRQDWRDRRLMALTAHLNSLSGDA